MNSFGVPPDIDFDTNTSRIPSGETATLLPLTLNLLLKAGSETSEPDQRTILFVAPRSPECDPERRPQHCRRRNRRQFRGR